jgi:large subunit ribosomal protein L15
MSIISKIYPHHFQGADIFDAKINIEVQWTNEVTIAAIEKNGGTITSRFFDMLSLQAAIDPHGWFKKGRPIPRCKLPPQDAVVHYADAKKRGYLADPDEINEARYTLAQKYGYVLPDLSEDPMFDMLMMRKDPRQIFYGLAPGWVVNLKDRKICKPKCPEFVEYNNS